MRLEALTLLTLCACPGPTDTADSEGPPALVDLWGTVSDPYLALTPVDGAWVLLDLGDEQLGVRSGADGSFSIPGLPADQPVALTVALEDHMAVSYTGLLLGELEMPLDLRTHARDPDSYATETMTISGTVSGAPAGSYVMFFGPTDADLDTSYLDYVQVSPDQSVAYELRPELVLPGDDYVLSALAYDASSWEVVASSAGTVSWGGSESLDFVLDPDALQSLGVVAVPPYLDGQQVAAIPEEYCSSIAITHLGESMSTTTGYNLNCEAGAANFDLTIGWVPVDGYTDRLQLYLFDDISTGTYAYGSLPIPDGATSMDAILLDSPILSTHDEMSQGSTLSWEPIDDVTGYMLYGYDGDGSLAWYLYPGDDSTSFEFPRFPADFDTSIILEDGDWAVISRHLVYDDDGLLDQSEPYTGSITHGGQLFL
jgi:hypothetical protein